MKLHVANSIETAIKLQVKEYGQHKVEQAVNDHIEHLFGGIDGDYFILNSMIKTNLTGREFKIVLVEDRDKVHHQVFFELIRTEPSTTIRTCG